MGDRVWELEEQKTALVQENNQLYNQVASSSAYSSVARRAQDELGLAYSPTAIDYVYPPMVAVKP